MLDTLGSYADWCTSLDMLVGVEMEPHVYYLLKDTWKLYRALSQLGRPNLYANIDIGHFLLTREGPDCLDKFAGRLYHGHLSETDGLTHSNSILGEGKVDFSAYLKRCRELGMERDCEAAGIDPVFCMEISEADSRVDSAEAWFDKSLDHLRRFVPELSL
jgi:sugar phosphate isomerase/epimerase